ncbi:Cytochrome P450 [Dillenia turbinata]|uniref:Cytochrome P450 n=1 Tax=Dillenia turbinata TaxID=194707 RepID=A0AAN8ZLG9_9MAGN
MADFQGYIVLFLIWLISIIVMRAIFARPKTNIRLPPSPIALPILGHLHLLAPIPHQALHKLSQRYGSLMYIFLGSVPCLVASSAEMAKELLKTHETSFSDRPQSVAVDYLTYGSQDFSFSPYGPYWKFMKKLCMTELLGGRTLDMLLPVRQDEIRRLLQFLAKKAKVGEAVDIGGELMSLTNNVISRMTMSQRCTESEGAGDIKKLVQETAELTGKFNLSDYIGFCKNLDLQGFKKRLKEVRDRFDAMMERIIKEHEDARRKKKMGDQDEKSKDLLDILLDISEDKASEMRLTVENIKAFILNCSDASFVSSYKTASSKKSAVTRRPLPKSLPFHNNPIAEQQLINQVNNHVRASGLDCTRCGLASY